MFGSVSLGFLSIYLFQRYREDRALALSLKRSRAKEEGKEQGGIIKVITVEKEEREREAKVHELTRGKDKEEQRARERQRGRDKVANGRAVGSRH